MNKKKKEDLVCCYCEGICWCVRGEKLRNGKIAPFFFPCPMCNPHGDHMITDVDRGEIEKLIEERKKIVPKEQLNP